MPYGPSKNSLLFSDPMGQAYVGMDHISCTSFFTS